MQIKKLKEISEVIVGYTFRGALKHQPDAKNYVILAKHINEDGAIDYSEMVGLAELPPRTNALATKDDILLSSRGIFRAGLFKKDISNVVIASSIFILRPTSKIIFPEYLSIYLNSELGQSSLKKIRTGGAIKILLRRALENLLVPIPPLPVQRQIIAINQNWKKRQILLNQKINLSKNIAEGAINKLLTM